MTDQPEKLVMDPLIGLPDLTLEQLRAMIAVEELKDPKVRERMAAQGRYNRVMARHSRRKSDTNF